MVLIGRVSIHIKVLAWVLAQHQVKIVIVKILEDPLRRLKVIFN
jgi:hypothetical protein